MLTSRTDNNGTTVIEQNNLVTGTATDSNGATYGFNYHNQATTTLPPEQWLVYSGVTAMRFL